MKSRKAFFKRKNKPVKFLKVLFWLGPIMTMLAIILIFFLQPNISIDDLKDGMKQSTEIYDADGELASKVTANKSEDVRIEDVPQHVQDAVIAIEDHRFMKHHGIDFFGVVRAIGTNIKAGGITEGASTLTQQLVKTTLLTPDRTFKRKMDEFFLAREVEREFSKEEILELYLNKVYFGHGAWGIQKASKIYFGKDVQELTVSEAALLAGVINVPGKLDPFNHFEASKKRRNLVLSRMQEHGYLSADEAKKAKSEQIVLTEDGKGDPLKGKYPYYVDHVLSEASKKYDLELEDLLTGGYKIYTSLDQKMQKAAEEVYADPDNFPKSPEQEAAQSGTVLLDSKTGGIKALVGGRGEHQFMGYNRATQLQASPGSTMKPLAVYTPALEQGYSITAPLKDEKMDFNGYSPSNLGDTYKGQVPMFQAAMESLNVPTVWLLNEIGIDNGLDSLKRFGIPTVEEDRNLGIALGGLKYGVAPIHMAEAYSAFANKGVRHEAHAIERIEDAQGKEVVSWKEKKTKVTTKEITDKINTMLLGVVEYGTGSNAKVSGHEIAGKTGSTQAEQLDISGAVQNQWFVGYTPGIVGAVWAGFDKTDNQHYLTTNSSQGATLVFQKIMKKALEDEPAESFHVEDISGLMTEQKKIEEREQRRQYWRDKGDQIRDGWNKFKNKILPNQDANDESAEEQQAEAADSAESKPRQEERPKEDTAEQPEMNKEAEAEQKPKEKEKPIKSEPEQAENRAEEKKPVSEEPVKDKPEAIPPEKEENQEEIEKKTEETPAKEERPKEEEQADSANNE
ncbi:transglycosylase domain-containing protein [Bacillus massiliglaciei]|uniref:transglycosylase domain-containing protein n=1 Tax=Bacillus massiliglaciei TaxID=1816693 RepID=UPI0018FE21E3|nr:PBP1A family penicillin-binding protein [Bacillus massiliglaciei]